MNVNISGRLFRGLLLQQISKRTQLYHSGGISPSLKINAKCVPASVSYNLQRSHRIFSSKAVQVTEQEEAAKSSFKEEIFKVDLVSLENSLPPSSPRTKSRTLMDLWVEVISLKGKESPENSSALIQANLNWRELFNTCKKLDRIISKPNFGGLILTYCLKHKSLALAQNYLKWDINPSIATLTLYARLCSQNYDLTSNNGVGEEDVIQIYEQVKVKNKGVWDLDGGERMIDGLCKTRLWQDSFSIIESMKVGGRPTGSCYAAVASAAFANGKFDIGWNVLTENAGHFIPDQPFIAWLEYCEPNEENMRRLLEFMDMYEQYGTGDSLVTAIKSYFQDKLHYTAKDTDLIFGAKAREKGEIALCGSCSTPIKSSNLTTEEFKTLQEHFLDRVLVSTDLFYNTTPQELEDYKKFVNETGPFDYVIDGLNVAFCRGQNGNPGACLREVVLHLHRQRFKILVIGRRHMMKWPVKHINHIRRMSRCFFINDESQDDPFMIWAALKSGPTARFVSKDLLRNHSYRLNDPELARLFKRWRFSSQLSVAVDYRGGVSLPPFTQIFPVPQKDSQNGNWHVPYQLDSSSPYDIPKKWICLKS